MNLTEGPAARSFPGPIKFDEKGRRQNVPMIFAQWQKGVPVTVFPEDRALAKAVLAEELKQTASPPRASLRRHRNAVKWRSIPSELGP